MKTSSSSSFKEANNQDLSIVSDISSRVFQFLFIHICQMQKEKVVEVVNDQS